MSSLQNALLCLSLSCDTSLLGLKGHSQLVHMHIRYYFKVNLHIALHLKKRVPKEKREARLSKPCRIQVKIVLVSVQY